jgi:hypothetical protein
MKKILGIGLVLAALLIATAAPAAAADGATATITKAWVIGTPGGLLLNLGSEGTGAITVPPGARLIIMGMAKKDGKEAMSFNLFNTTAEPAQPVVTKAFQAKAKKQAKVIQYKFTPVSEGDYTFRFNVSDESGTELDWAEFTVTVANP